MEESVLYALSALALVGLGVLGKLLSGGAFKVSTKAYRELCNLLLVVQLPMMFTTP